MNKFNIYQKLDGIINAFPQVSIVLKAYQIDYLNNRDKTIKETSEEKFMDPELIIKIINVLYNEFHKQIDNNDDNFLNMPIDDLAGYVFNNHHAYIHTNLPKIGELSKLISRVHGTNHPELIEVYNLFNTLSLALKDHLTYEDTNIYSIIGKYNESKDLALPNQIHRMIEKSENEHGKILNILQELRKITNNYKVPSDACGTYKRTFMKMLEFEDHFFQHIYLENIILFPKLIALIQ